MYLAMQERQQRRRKRQQQNEHKQRLFDNSNDQHPKQKPQDRWSSFTNVYMPAPLAPSVPASHATFRTSIVVWARDSSSRHFWHLAHPARVDIPRRVGDLCWSARACFSLCPELHFDITPSSLGMIESVDPTIRLHCLLALATGLPASCVVSIVAFLHSIA
jgi:hypothetical protein